MSQRIEASEGDDRAWQDQANCLGVDPDLFFPERGASTREAKEVCRGCEVRQQCLDYALATAKSSVSGVGCLSASAVACVVSVPRPTAVRPLPKRALAVR